MSETRRTHQDQSGVSTTRILLRALGAIVLAFGALAAFGAGTAGAQGAEPGADMAISATDGGASYSPGDIIEYEITVTNVGTGFANQVFVSIWVPEHTTMNLAASTPGFSCSPSLNPFSNCTVQTAGVAVGESWVVTLAVTVDATLPAGADETTLHLGCDQPAPFPDCRESGVFIGGSPFPEPDYANNRTQVVTQLGEPCQPGTFSATGSAPCTPAQLGTFVATAAATAATDCEIGTYQPLAGQAECLRAPVGSYVDVTAASAATPCPDGTSTVGIGSANVADCLADFDGDGMPDVVDPDDDNDGVDDSVDRCAGTVLADDEAPRRLKRNRTWSDASGAFVGTDLTVVDTHGCSASQIIEAAGLGNGHRKFGISDSALQDWVASS